MFQGRTWLLAIFTLLACGSLVGYRFGRKSVNGDFANGGLEVDPARLDLGEVWEQKGFEWVLPIHNATPRDIQIERWLTSCGCLEVTPASPLIPTSQTVGVGLIFDLTTGIAGESDPRRRPFSATIVPVIREGLPNSAGWTFQGTVRRALSVAPPVLSFDESLVAGERFESRTVEVSGAEARLADLKVQTAQAPWATVDLEPTGQPDRFRVRVRPKETAAVGPHPFAIILRGVTTSGESLPPVTLPVVMDVVDDIRVDPTHLVFGALTLGKSAESTVLIHSRTGKRCALVAAERAAQTGTTVERLPGPSDRIAIGVRQQAIAPGAQEHDVPLLLQVASANVARKVQLRVSYFGVADGNPDRP